MPLNQSGSAAPLTLRSPGPHDAWAICQLVRQCPPLDTNSTYAYLLQTLHLADSCVVACHDQTLAGYLSAYVPPRQPDLVFVWQIAVAPAWRGQRLAQRMLDELLRRPAVRQCRWLETTITPSNAASLRLFSRLAEQLQTRLYPAQVLPAHLFGNEGHESEQAWRIGPLPERFPLSITDRSNS